MNLNHKYGRAQSSNMPYTTGKVFFVAPSSGPYDNEIEDLYTIDEDGVKRTHSDFNSAVSECVADRGDVIVMAPDFNTSISQSDLDTAESKGVVVVQAGKETREGVKIATQTAQALPQSTAEAIFNVKNRVKILSIVGEVTTDIQNQANNTKLIASPSAAGLSDVDLCSTVDIANDSDETIYTITGTLANALQKNANGVIQAQADPVIVPEGSIDLSCSASNTGEVKWYVEYVPVDFGGRVFAA